MGLLVLPYYLLFELLGPFVELVGIVAVPLGLAVGAVDSSFAWRFLLVAYAYAFLLLVVALAVEEYSFHWYDRWRDLWAAMAASVAENLGYRQPTALWRAQGTWAVIRGRRAEWGVMERVDFSGTPPGARR